MKRSFKFIALTSCMLLIISCKKQNLLPSTDRETSQNEFANLNADVEIISQYFVIAFNKADSTKLSNLYAKDAKMFLPNQKAVQGRKNIKTAFHHLFKDGVPTFTMKTNGVWGNDELLIAEKEYTLSDIKGNILDTGKSLEYYIKEDNTWKIYRDCINSDMPLE